MTDSIPLKAMGIDKVRRDQWSRYLVLPPEGPKPVGYTRATTVAETLEDGYGLQKWFAVMVVVGTLIRRGLRARWEALLARTGGDPWYFDEASKQECKALAAEGAAMGGAHDRAEIGTALHDLTARVTGGLPVEHVSDETRADIDAFVQALAVDNITLDPLMVEQVVVLDSLRIGGTFDGIATVPDFALPLIADLKTGADLSFSWHSIAAQLAIYSRADAIYRQGAAEDGSLDVRVPMPAVDQENGLIIWLPAGTATCSMFLVDLTAGWDAVQHSLWVREWRKRTVNMPLTSDRFRAPTTDENLGAALEASLKLIDVEQVEPYEVRLRAWLQSRIEDIGHHENARHDLLEAWPEDVPGLLSDHRHTADELVHIEIALDAVERRHAMPWPEPRPVPDEDEGLGLILQMFPGAIEVPPPTTPGAA